MKRFKSRIIGVISIFIIIACAIVIPQIYAEDTTVKEESLSCETLAERYGLYMQEGKESGTYDLIKDSQIACSQKESDINRSFKITKINGSGTSAAVGQILSETNNKITIAAGQLQDATKYYVTVTLQNTANQTEEITIEHAITKEEAVRANVTGTINDNYNGKCKSFREIAGSIGSEKYNFFYQALPYCWESSSIISYTAQELQTKIDNITSLWEIFQNQYESSPGDFITFKNNAVNAGNTIADPSSQTLTLKCAYDRVKTGTSETAKTYTNQYGESISSASYYLNTDYYYSSNSSTDGTVKYTYNYAPGNSLVVTQDACKRTCEEAVKVEYGPPVASKAGLCFEYKVKVTSYVKCNATVIAKPPETKNNYCNPSPRCEDTKGVVREQAGPTEDFDNCIKSCDGGKYTEKCSLKCYKEVYGKDLTKLAINYESAKATKLASTRSDNEYSVAECLDENQGYFGCYMYSGSEIEWYSLVNYNLDGNSKGSPYPDLNNRFALGRWYLDRVYKQSNGTYITDQWSAAANYNYNNGGYPITNIKQCTGKKYCGTYHADKSGFYRDNYGGTPCEDKCTWRTDVCSKDEYLNPGTMVADAKRNQEEYQTAVAACIASASCSQHTAEFSISINYDTKTGENVKVNTITFPYETKTDKLNANKANSIDKNRTTILQYDGCYDDYQHKTNFYMTEWSFPGTYIHNKTGEITFQKPEAPDGWYYDDKKFCMPLDAESVNTKWWEWYKLGNNCYTDAQIEEELRGKTGTSNGYNITAKARRFGYFGWNFDIKCFYGLRNEICNVDNRGCCGDSKNETNGVSNYTFRSVDIDNLFPNAVQAGVVDNTKREIGFNWTDKAITLKNNDYEINPPALIDHIQNNASSLYNNDSTNLDYKFYLTPSTLSKIREYNNKNEYADWMGTTEEINGVNVYKSNIFRNVGTGKKILTEVSGAIVELGTPGVNNENYIKFGG